ncbi:MAG: hypothetical protein RML36_06795 [Anaerolineae bacterium]|jgi:TRAP-type C4-dicarboxylate transport system permease small subunit|nr:hypothetical protein [Anaerolineae bacterium]MDW8099176.1 hypothetical protein [Anaerolineae bacterium]
MESRYRVLRILALISLVLSILVFIWGLWNGLAWQSKAGYEGLTAPGGLKFVLRMTLFCIPFGPALFFATLLFLAASGLQLVLDAADRMQAVVEDLRRQASGG